VVALLEPLPAERPDEPEVPEVPEVLVVFFFVVEALPVPLEEVAFLAVSLEPPDALALLDEAVPVVAAAPGLALVLLDAEPSEPTPTTAAMPSDAATDEPTRVRRSRDTLRTARSRSMLRVRWVWLFIGSSFRR
jgi:hypothetical protein